jgi:hypothetical protein
MLEPDLCLEKIDPSKKGELKVLKSIHLFEADGTSSFKLGCYKDTREILGLMVAFINGETLYLEYEKNGKLNVVQFEVENGKLIGKKALDIAEKTHILSFDPKRGIICSIGKAEEEGGEGEKILISKFTLAGFGKNPNATIGGAQVKDEAYISKI